MKKLLTFVILFTLLPFYAFNQSTEILTDVNSTSITPANIVTDGHGNDFLVYFIKNGDPNVLNSHVAVTKIDNAGNIVFTKQYQFTSQGPNHFVLFSHAILIENELYLFGYTSHDGLSTFKFSVLCVGIDNGNIIRKFYSDYNSQISPNNKLMPDVVNSGFYQDDYFFILELQTNLSFGTRWNYANVYRLKKDFTEFKLFKRFDNSQPINSRYFVPISISNYQYINDGSYFFMMSGNLFDGLGDDRIGEFIFERNSSIDSYSFYRLSFGTIPVRLSRTYWWDGTKILIGHLDNKKAFKKYSANPSILINQLGVDAFEGSYISSHDQFNFTLHDYAIPGLLGDINTSEVYSGSLLPDFPSGPSPFYSEQALYSFSFRAHSNRYLTDPTYTVRPSFIFERNVFVNGYRNSFYYLPERITAASCEQSHDLEDETPKDEEYIQINYSPPLISDVNLHVGDLAVYASDRLIAVANVCNEARFPGSKENTKTVKLSYDDIINYSQFHITYPERLQSIKRPVAKNLSDKRIESKRIKEIRYFNMIGQELLQFKGLNLNEIRYQGVLIKVVYYDDNSFLSSKVYLPFR